MKARIVTKVKCLGGKWHRIGLSKTGEVILFHHTALVGDPNAQSATVMHGLGSPVRCVEVKGAWERCKALGSNSYPRDYHMLPKAFQEALVYGIEEVAMKIDGRPDKLKSKRATNAAARIKTLEAKARVLQGKLRAVVTRLKSWKAKLKRYEKEGVEIREPKKNMTPEKQASLTNAIMHP